MFKDLLTGEEFYSDAKTLEPVKWVDPDTKEEVDTGLVRCIAKNSTEGGGAVDIGAGNAFGGGGEDEGADDAQETKLDQFWTFPAIEVSAESGRSLPRQGHSSPRRAATVDSHLSSTPARLPRTRARRTRSPSPALPSSRRRTSCPSW